MYNYLIGLILNSPYINIYTLTLGTIVIIILMVCTPCLIVKFDSSRYYKQEAEDHYNKEEEL